MKLILEKNIIFLQILLSASLLTMVSVYVSNATPYYDDFFILEPIIYKLKNGSFPFLRYPEFPYLFYEKLILLVNSIFKFAGPYVIASAINCFLLPLNSFLFYLNAKNFLEKKWALLGAALFGFAPAVFFSSSSVKTESLLLTQLFLSIFLSHKWSIKKSDYLWPILAGLVSALAIGTKYNFSIPIIFPIFCLHETLFKKARLASLIRPISFFSISLILITLLFFPTILNFGNFVEIEEIKNDIMFSPFPNAYKAVGEWNAFPAGRFSYAFFHSLPLIVGPIIFIFSIIAHLLKLIPKNVLLLWGGSSFIHFVGVSLMTPYRLPYYYTLCTPYLVISSLFLLQSSIKIFKFEILKMLMIFGVLLYQIYNFTGISNVFHEYTEVIQNTTPQLRTQLLGHEENYEDFFNWELNLSNSAVRGDLVYNHVLEKRPKYIFTSAQMVRNYCNYKSDLNYLKHCKYFSQLLNEKKGYRLIWKKDIPLPFYNPFFHEKYFSFYLLEKKIK
jgi:hypothetical protein